MQINRYSPFFLRIVFFLALQPLLLNGQRPSPPVFGDLHVHSLLKPRTSGIPDPWPFWEHSCPQTAYDLVLNSAGSVPKYTQSDFESLINGNVRLACVSLTPLEHGMRHPVLFKNLEKLRNSYACMGGFTPDWEFFLDEEVNYFEELMEGLEMLAQLDGKPHYMNGDTAWFELIGSSEQLDRVLADPRRMAVVLSIEGAHSFGRGPSGEAYLSEEDHESELMENIEKLKGIRPVKEGGETFPHSICFVTLNHFMWNGLSGHAKTFFGAQAKVFDQSDGMESGVTPMGQRVIQKLLDKEQGRRILIDVKHMSMASRRWYYKYLEELAAKGDTVPIVASHVGVAQSSWEGLEEEKSRKKADKENWLSNLSISMFKEDIEAIYRSKGILGIMLDKYRIGGGLGKELVDGTRAGSRERRMAYVHLIVANMVAVVDVLKCKEAWNIIGIGSDFDGMISAMDTYDRATAFPQLRDDLLAYFSDPEDLFDLYSKRTVVKYMYDLPAESIVNKVMGGNLHAFFRRNLPPSARASEGETSQK